MKQHISKEQAKDAPYVFSTLMSIEGISCPVYDGIFEQGLYQKDVELITIGEMIDILDSLKQQTEVLEIYAPIGLIDTWKVWYANGDFPKKYESKILCDALWEAVKVVINE